MSTGHVYVRRAARPADHFTIVANGFLRDRRLSAAARGVGAWLLSHALDFQVSTSAISAEFGTGRDVTRRILAELETAGYLVRERTRSGGKLVGTVFLMSDAPAEEPQVAPGPEIQGVAETAGQNQRLENQGLVNQGLAGAAHKKTNSTKTTGKKITTTDAPADADAPAESPELNAGQVVAAFVDAYRAAHQGHDPLSQDVRKVAGTAKRLLSDPKLNADVLLAAATSLGRSQFTDLAGQYRRELSQPGAGQRGQGVTYVQAEVQPGRWDALLAQQEETNRRITQGTPAHLEASA